jgi:hypothetical protein
MTATSYTKRVEAMMKSILRYVVPLAIASSALVACESEDLSVGAPRCQGVSCAPHENEGVDDVSPESPERVILPDLAQTRSVVLPCPFEQECWSLGIDLQWLERQGQGSVLVASSIGPVVPEETPVEQPLPERGIWVGRYIGTELQGESFVEDPPELGDGAAFVLAFAASSSEPDEALLVVNYESPDYQTLAVYDYDDEDQLERLFEVDEPMHLHDAARIGDDILVVGDYQNENVELARYTRDGELVFRQSALRSTPPDLYASFQVAGPAQIRVTDDDQIVVLVPRAYKYELVVLNARGQVLWSTWVAAGFIGEASYTARLAIAPDGAIVVGLDGYMIHRFERDEDGLRSTVVERRRQEYFDLDLNGLEVGASGTSYFGLIEGVVTEPHFMLERVGPQLSTIESAELQMGDDGPCQWPFSFGGQLVIDSEEREAYATDGGCLTVFPLPALDD